MAGRELLLDSHEQAELAIELHREGLFGVREREEDYIKLKSERMSPHYFDIRPGISSPDTRLLVVHSMLNLARARVVQKGGQELRAAYDHLAGTPEAMTSYAALLAHEAEMSLLQPRVDLNKASGNKTPILGRFQEGDTVADFDDVVTDGKSKIDAVTGLRAAGLSVEDYFVVVDREEGGAPQVEAATGVEITPALGVSAMVKILREEGAINVVQFDNVRRYMDQYGEPHAQELLAA